MRRPATCALNLFAAFWILIATAFAPAHSVDFALPLYDDDDKYFENILRAALKAADGDHTLRTLHVAIPQSRVIRSLLDDRGMINVLYTGHSSERERLMRQIDIPLSRGLLGLRVFVIRADNAHLFGTIETLDQLTGQITVGSGVGWPDTPILRAAGFDVKTGSVHNLWQMLAHNRFVAYPRGMNEVLAELKRYARTTLQVPMVSENTIMIAYRFDHFFYVGPEDETRAHIIRQGLDRIYESGEFLKIFYSDPAVEDALNDARQHNRKIYYLPNPLNSDRVRQIPEKYWIPLEEIGEVAGR